MRLVPRVSSLIHIYMTALMRGRYKRPHRKRLTPQQKDIDADRSEDAIPPNGVRNDRRSPQLLLAMHPESKHRDQDNRHGKKRNGRRLTDRRDGSGQGGKDVRQHAQAGTQQHCTGPINVTPQLLPSELLIAR